MDAHAHVFRPVAASPRGCDDLAPAERDAPVEELLVAMAGAGAAHAVLVPLDGADDYVAEVVTERPATFAGIAVATAPEQGRTPTDPVRALIERRARYPFVALRSGWLGDPGSGAAASPMLPVLRDLAEGGIALWSYLPPDQLPLLHEAVRLVPELRVVLNHLGFIPHGMWIDRHRRPRFIDALAPPLVDDLLRLADAPAVHLMVSAQYALSADDPPYPDLFAPTRRLAAAFGPDRLLWGSDFPWPAVVPGYRTLPDLVAAALPDLTPTQLTDVLGGNALRLFAGHFAAHPPRKKEH
ncbi:amidohydrolase family protein [Pseudonocardia nigra]|uniref:amidohydrolase family protein n=1 Tax=Pseudonocardia nigra TaxID=1921578 RepID=UPI001C5F9DB4|nr:amidohydrolase family protein [Pseudonocardia nigra]